MNLVASEFSESVALLTWAKLATPRYPELEWLFHVANGELRDKRLAAKLKAAGVKPGVSDYMLPAPRGPYAGLFLELKRTKGWQVSAAQLRFIGDMERQGYRALVCPGWVAAKEAIEGYLNLPKTGNNLTLVTEATCVNG